MSMNLNNEELKFPVEWHYKIIVLADCTEVKDQLSRVFARHGFMVEPVPGHKSKNGKYLTYNATVTFQNKTEMTLLSEELATVESVKFLL